ncbi:MAG: adenine phosphoribosyltransferase [Pseudonocardia sp.]
MAGDPARGDALRRAAGLIHDVPDYPSPGVLFRDITPMLADAAAFAAVVAAMAEPVAGAERSVSGTSIDTERSVSGTSIDTESSVSGTSIDTESSVSGTSVGAESSVSGTSMGADVVVGVEARGFLLGAAVAHAAGVGVVAVRKAGKLPAVAASREYQLEYGKATLELPAGALAPGSRVFLVDDVLATGGTLVASRELIEQVGATVAGVGVLIELAALAGRAQLGATPVHALFTF